MELETKRLRIIALDAHQMELLCLGRAALERELGLEPAAEVWDSHLDAAYAEMLNMCRANEKDYFWYTNWQIILKDENRFIGSLGFFGAPGSSGETEIGYGIDENYRRRGYACEAVEAAAEWATSNGVRCLRAQTESDNAASKRVLCKCGFLPDGTGDEGEMFRLMK